MPQRALSRCDMRELEPTSISFVEDPNELCQHLMTQNRPIRAAFDPLRAQNEQLGPTSALNRPLFADLCRCFRETNRSVPESRFHEGVVPQAAFPSKCNMLTVGCRPADCRRSIHRAHVAIFSGPCACLPARLCVLCVALRVLPRRRLGDGAMSKVRADLKATTPGVRAERETEREERRALRDRPFLYDRVSHVFSLGGGLRNRPYSQL